VLLCDPLSRDINTADAAAATAAVAAQRMHVPAVLLNDDAVRTKELLEPLQPGRSHQF
jgi:hypothetical protein